MAAAKGAPIKLKDIVQALCQQGCQVNRRWGGDHLNADGADYK
jgi:hypothetical protein